MTFKTSLAAVVMLGLLVGCGGPLPGVLNGTVAGELAQAAIASRQAAQPAADLGGGTGIRAVVANSGLDMRMSLLDRDGDVAIWHDGQGRQIATRNGIMIWTRGFGADLMSAKVPNPGDIRLGNQYQRFNVYVDGADTRLQRTYDCTVELPREPDPSTPGQQLQEVCDGPVGLIRNEFWISGGRIVRSKQWISSRHGHIEILP